VPNPRARNRTGLPLRARRGAVRSRASRWLLPAALLLGAAPALAEDLPQFSQDMHLGVRECAGGPCHGSATPVGERVKENEHTIWLRRDRHAQAY